MVALMRWAEFVDFVFDSDESYIMSRAYTITIASFLRHELRQVYKMYDEVMA